MTASTEPNSYTHIYALNFVSLISSHQWFIDGVAELVYLTLKLDLNANKLRTNATRKTWESNLTTILAIKAN